MPANGRWDLIRRLKFKYANLKKKLLNCESSGSHRDVDDN